MLALSDDERQRPAVNNDDELIFDFSATPGYTGVGRVELVMFICPDWDLAPATISFFLIYFCNRISTLLCCEYTDSFFVQYIDKSVHTTNYF